MKKIFILLSFFILLMASHTLYLTPSLAIDSTSSADLSDNLKIKLKTLQDEISSRAAKLKQEISNKLQNKVYIGVVKSKSDNSLIMATKTGSRIVNVNEYTEYSNFTKLSKQNLSKGALKSASVEDYVATLGDVDDNEVLTAKRIIKLENPEGNEKKIVWGQITSINNHNFNLQTKDKESLSFSWNENTTFIQNDTAGNSDDLKVGNTIIIVGQNQKSGQYQSLLIYLFAQSNTFPASSPTPLVASPSSKGKSIY